MFFVDPYLKYNEELNKIDNISLDSEKVLTNIKSIYKELNDIPSILSDINLEDKDLEEKIKTTIDNTLIFQDNIENVLKMAVRETFGSLLPETEKLKIEDANYEELTNTLNNLVVPVQYDENKEETTLYKNYLKEKEEIKTKQKESENRCLEYQRKCDEIIGSLKVLDKSTTALNKVIKTSKKSKEEPKIEIIEGVGSGTMYKINFYGDEFQVANTKTNLFEYVDFLKNNEIYQESGFKVGMSDLLSQQYVIDLLKGIMTPKDKYQTNKYFPTLKINNTIKSQEQDKILEFTYDELSAGRPIILQVTQDRSKEGLRHMITVVGYSSLVSNFKDLNTDRLLVLDNYDGKVEKLSKKDRKLFNQGGKGYKAIGASKEFLEIEVYKVK